MKILIDENQCHKYKLSLKEALILMAMQVPGDPFDATLKNLVNRGILYEKGGQYHTDSLWAGVVADIMAGNTVDEDNLLELAKEMRKHYPDGKMPGTAYYYRGNTREIALKLKKFFTQYGKYSNEDIVNAVKRFVAAYNGNYKFLPLLKYFISKNKLVVDEDGSQHVAEVSLLATFLENEDTEVSNVSDDWLMAARN